MSIKLNDIEAGYVDAVINSVKSEMKQITRKLTKEVKTLTDRESELMMFYQSHGEEQGAIEYVKNKLNK